MRRGSGGMANMLTFVALLVVLAYGTSYGADYIDLVKKGNKSFQQADYKKALDYYHQAETELPESPELQYNIAGALYQDGGYEQAVDKYTKALNTTDIKLEAAALYNLGNTYFRMQDYQNAIKSYEEALKLNPNDMDAKFNLELARRRFKEQIKPQQQQNQQQNQQQQNQQQQDQNQHQNQEQQQQQNQQQQQQDQQKQDQQQQNQQQQNQNNQEQPQQQQQQQEMQKKKEMSKEDAERILNALRDDEREIQKKIRRQATKSGNYQGNDW